MFKCFVATAKLALLAPRPTSLVARQILFIHDDHHLHAHGVEPVLCTSGNANIVLTPCLTQNASNRRAPMRNLLRCRRGSAALATIIALVPLIGAVALGGEAGIVVRHQAARAECRRCGSLFGRPCGWHAQLLRLHMPRHTNSGLSGQGICRPERILQRGRHHRLSRLPVCHQPSDRNLAGRPDQYCSLHGTGTTELSFRPLLASHSQRTSQNCLVCPPST